MTGTDFGDTKEMGNSVLAHDRNDITAANNHVGMNEPESSESGQDFFSKSTQIADEAKFDPAQQEVAPTTTPLRSAIDIAMAREGQIEKKVNQETIQQKNITSTPLRSAVEIAMAGDGQIEQKVNQEVEGRSTPTEQDFFSTSSTPVIKEVKPDTIQQEVTPTNAPLEKKITSESVNKAIESGSLLTVKVLRSSGEIEDGWSVINIFTDDNGVERARVIKFDANTGQQVVKNVPLEDLERLNSQEEQGTGYFNTMMNPEEAKRYENAYGHLENLKTIKDIQQEIAQKIQNSTVTQPESTVTQNVNSGTPVAEGTSGQPETQQEEVTPTPPENVTPVITTVAQSTEGTATATVEQGTQGPDSTVEETWEQKAGKINRELERLDQIRREERELTDAEKIQYFDLLNRKDYLDNMIIAPIEQENKAKRDRKEKIIKRGARVVGFGVAALTPPISLAAMLAIGLGGPVIGKGLKTWGEKLRSQSTSMKYADRSDMNPEELEKFDEKEKRKEWWANRLGEAASIVTGGAVGYGLGKAVQNILGLVRGASNAATASTTAEATGTAEVGRGPIETPPAPQPIPQEAPSVTGGHIDAAPLQGGIETTGESVLAQNGRIDLPGSAWDGSPAAGPAQEILAGGATNHSNYAGGIYDMAASTLEKDLVSNGITRPELFNTLKTPEIHQLLNRYVETIRGGNVQPSLPDILTNMNPDAASTLLGN